MEVLLSHKQQKQTRDLVVLRRDFGKSGDEIADCLNVLAAVDNLQMLCSLPPSLNHRCHELKGNLKGVFSMDLIHPYRFLFRPGNPTPRLENNTIDRAAVRTICVQELCADTHG